MVAGLPAYGLHQDDSIALEGDKIVWVGCYSDLPDLFLGAKEIDLAGKLVTPALIDCHTHLVFGGDRAKEFEMRLNGASYEEIARAGGGIVSTVKATRTATEDELIETALPRLDALIAEGVTTLEIKSGYGLDTDVELRMLRAARRLTALRPVTICTTFLGVHATPPRIRRSRRSLYRRCLHPCIAGRARRRLS